VTLARQPSLRGENDEADSHDGARTVRVEQGSKNVLPHGPDRNLSVDEIGGIQLAEETVSAEA
jgi:hypothetical protein